jgi:RNA polymerase-binding transcription factor DksA
LIIRALSNLIGGDNLLDTSRYKQILLEMKQDISGRITAIDRDIRHEGMSADWTEQASERENDEVLESLGNSSEQELAMIKLALRRIDSGDYFHCVECGEDIPVARLDLLPFTPYCVNCAEKIED